MVLLVKISLSLIEELSTLYCFTVTDAEPPVADLDQLVDKLNNTNDLKSFMVAMRKRFQQILTSKN
jgi:hypothetical protein